MNADSQFAADPANLIIFPAVLLLVLGALGFLVLLAARAAWNRLRRPRRTGWFWRMAVSAGVSWFLVLLAFAAFYGVVPPGERPGVAQELGRQFIPVMAAVMFVVYLSLLMLIPNRNTGTDVEYPAKRPAARPADGMTWANVFGVTLLSVVGTVVIAWLIGAFVKGEVPQVNPRLALSGSGPYSSPSLHSAHSERLCPPRRPTGHPCPKGRTG